MVSTRSGKSRPAALLDEPDGGDLARLRAAHAASGLWPVLIGGDPNRGEQQGANQPPEPSIF